MKVTLDPVIFHRCAIDYITITSYSEDTNGILMYALRQALGDTEYDCAENAKQQQYTGLKTRYAFWGTGKQEDKLHFLATVKGAAADKFAELVRSFLAGTTLQHNCSRLDCQYTRIWANTREERTYPMTSVATTIENAYKHSHDLAHRPRNVLRMGSDKTGWTLYIGSMHSDRFSRLYEKQTPEHYGTRFEVQLRSEYASNAWRYMLTGGSAAGVLKSELEMIPGSQEYLSWAWMGVEESTIMPAFVSDAVSSPEKKLSWILKQVAPSLREIKAHYGDETFWDLLRAMVGD